MGISVTRVGDSTSGTCDVGDDCCPHGRGGTNSSGSPNVTINRKAAHRVGDSGSCNCPHGGSFNTTSGSKTVTVNGKSLSRVNDSTQCGGCGLPGTHTTGSKNVTCG